jgi:hypothetical protein
MKRDSQNNQPGLPWQGKFTTKAEIGRALRISHQVLQRQLKKIIWKGKLDANPEYVYQ